MRRLKVLFAIFLFLLALPLWRYLDFLVWVWPDELLYASIFFFWLLFFVILPLRLLIPKLHAALLLISSALLALYAWHLGPLSEMAADSPEHTHCGRLTYSGFFYPVHKLLTDAHQDDLEIRNQLCWVRKMVVRTPRRFDTPHELATYSEIIRDRLLKPQNKFRAVLPMVALLHGHIIAKLEEQSVLMPGFSEGRMFIEGLRFWQEQYTLEVRDREYAFWNFPHGPYIKWEYGIIERNWRSIMEGLSTEP